MFGICFQNNTKVEEWAGVEIRLAIFSQLLKLDDVFITVFSLSYVYENLFKE